MGDCFVFLSEDFVIGHGALRLMIFTGKHRDVRFKRIAFRFQALILALEGSDRFSYFFDFCFKLFGFAHAVMILLDRWNAQGTSHS